jgi:hypothetical protein
MKRHNIPLFVSRLVDGRPVRWATSARLVGDYDGRERTLQVFNADPKEQDELLDRIDAHREALEAEGPVVVIFHSRKQSAERYGDFVGTFKPWAPTEEPPAPPAP